VNKDGRSVGGWFRSRSRSRFYCWIRGHSTGNDSSSVEMSSTWSIRMVWIMLCMILIVGFGETTWQGPFFLRVIGSPVQIGEISTVVMNWKLQISPHPCYT
jgi:hypothetical protein